MSLISKKRDRRISRPAGRWDSCLIQIESETLERIDERMESLGWASSRSAWIRGVIESELAGPPREDRALEYAPRTNGTTRVLIRMEVGTMSRVRARMAEEGVQSQRMRSAWIRDVIEQRLQPE